MDQNTVEQRTPVIEGVNVDTGAYAWKQEPQLPGGRDRKKE
ncbi:hypothetical protein AYX15_07108 [Cryptococcus neoformans]|nr:hypothetical protein AYX15_07108 [Cryptococcus neoformans var. grubii]